MKEIRIGWSDAVSHDEHEMQGLTHWISDAPDVRRDYEIIVETANEVFGLESHWIEEREERQHTRIWKSRFDDGLPGVDTATSPYAQQLSAGFRKLRFAGALEAEYVSYLQTVDRRSAMVCAGVSLVAWLIFGVADWVRLAPVWAGLESPGWIWFVVGGRAVVSFLLTTVLLLTAQRHRFARPALTGAVVLLPMAFAAGLGSTLYKLHGLPQVDLALLLIVMAAFFPIGLTFHQSVRIACGMVLLGVLPGIVLLPPEMAAGHLNFAAVVLLTAIFASISGYLRELGHREHFLLRSLLAGQAALDPLTGLHNRRWMNEHVDVARRQARRDRKVMSFLIVDVDDFKQYNDHCGHPMGDAALTAVARILSGFARRPLDVASRLGGDEFGLLLYDCQLRKACDYAEQLRALFEEADMAYIGPDGIQRTLTVSIGAVQLRDDEATGDFYRRADRLLYDAKQSGRNLVRF